MIKNLHVCPKLIPVILLPIPGSGLVWPCWALQWTPGGGMSTPDTASPAELSAGDPETRQPVHTDTRKWTRGRGFWFIQHKPSCRPLVGGTPPATAEWWHFPGQQSVQSSVLPSPGNLAVFLCGARDIECIACTSLQIKPYSPVLSWEAAAWQVCECAWFKSHTRDDEVYAANTRSTISNTGGHLEEKTHLGKRQEWLTTRPLLPENSSVTLQDYHWVLNEHLVGV